MERKLAAILAADVVGYSRLIAEDEARTLDALRALRRELFEPLVEEHRGEVVKRMGDGWLVSFASVVDAAQCAIQVQVRLSGHDRIKLRIGVHLGDIVHEDEDIYGDGVNIAARLQEVTEPGGVMISGTAYESVIGRLDDKFADAGEQDLKNVSRPIRAWQWKPAVPAQTPPMPETAKGLDVRRGRPSIAVMPFTNLSSDTDAEFFADGMVDDVINALSKFRWLFVIARGTMLTYKGRSITADQAASELGVRYVFEGNVRQAGNRIRISVELVDTETGSAIWTERYDRSLGDIFLLQDEITEAIARSITPEIERLEVDRARRVPPSEVDAWLLYQKARNGVAEDGTGTETVIRYCEQVLALDPNFAQAYATSAEARCMLAQNVRPGDFDELIAEATREIKTALQLDPRDPDIQVSAARVNLGLGDFRQMMEHAQAAIDANPNSAVGYAILSMAHISVGEPQQALAAIEKAIAISPFDRVMRRFMLAKARAAFQLQDYEMCIEALERANSLGENATYFLGILMISYAKTGNSRDYDAVRRAIFERQPNFSIEFVQSALRRMPDIFVTQLTDGLRELGVPER